MFVWNKSIEPLVPTNWYKFDVASLLRYFLFISLFIVNYFVVILINKLKRSQQVLAKYGSNPVQALMHAYPELGLVESNFKSPSSILFFLFNLNRIFFFDCKSGLAAFWVHQTILHGIRSL
jgi:hypothetical protein